MRKYYSYKYYRGYIGEYLVKKKLKRLIKKDYKVLNNIYLKYNNKTYQIDHIIISKYGIFVIETKNIRGYIIGNDYKDDWKQYIWKKPHSFYNPIHQNYGHIEVLKELLHLEEDCFIPIICFSNKSKLNINTKYDVVSLSNLISTIKKYKDIKIESDIDIIYNRIKELNITDKKERKKHSKNIRKKLKEDNKKINRMICPKCGGQLVINIENKQFLTCLKCNFKKE